MRNLLSKLQLMLMALVMMACLSDDANAIPPTDNEQSNITMNLKVNDSTMKVQLADNAATKALVERLKEGAITYNTHDYGGFEKVGALGFSLPSNDTHITTEPGECILKTE